MDTYTHLICLANSRKYRGHCIAGKALEGYRLGRWIRPVSDQPTGELSTEEISYPNGAQPRPLDIIRIPLLQRRPHYYQTENYRVDTYWHWQRVGAYPLKNIERLQDNGTEVWYNGYHSKNGYNDRIPEVIAKQNLSSSLVFIKLQTILFTIGPEYTKRKVRAEFTYQNEMYQLLVTDLAFEKKMLAQDDGTYEFRQGPYYVTISLGEPYQGYCYKLIAAVLTP